MKKILLLFLFSLSFISYAQSPGDVAQNFGSLPGFNNAFNSTAKQPDGKIIMGGFFTAFKGVTENRIIRLNTDGNKDTAFATGTGFNDYVGSIVLHSDGKIFVGGNFTTYQDSNESASLIALHSETNLATENFTNANGVSLYPNPVKDILNIDLLDNTSISSVKIYDLQGKLLLEKASNDIDVSSLSAGLYLIKIATEKGEFTKKFIKE